jgi:predicted metal-dependent hydrolase
MNQQMVSVKLKIKKIKNVYLRMEKGELILSTNKLLTNEEIVSILQKHSKWIESQLINYANIACSENEILVFGKKRQIKQVSSNQINEDKNRIKQNALKEVEQLFRILEKKWGYHNCQIQFSKLKTKWGICYFKKQKIVLNEAIFQLPIYLIEYIILHELTHFEVHNHSKYFYEKLAMKSNNTKNSKVDLAKYNCIL